MGKKRIIKKGGGSDVSGTTRALNRVPKKKVVGGTLNILATPFAAAKVGEVIGEKAQQMGMKEAEVVVRGVGAGRESALRAFAGKGIAVTRISDKTPVPHNGPRPKKARRV